MDGRVKPGHDDWMVGTLEKSLHFLVISLLWG
jgi:hypothetical protein